MAEAHYPEFEIIYRVSNKFTYPRGHALFNNNTYNSSKKSNPNISINLLKAIEIYPQTKNQSKFILYKYKKMLSIYPISFTHF